MNIIQEYKELEVYFKDVDHIDVKTITSDTDLRAFISGMLSYHPWWMVFLFGIRKIIVLLLGLVHHEEAEALASITPEKLSFKPGAQASFFIVRSAKEETYWVAETPEDRHLTAFLGVVAEKTTKTCTRYHVFTSVKYLHWTGPVYFNLIRPFHHFVVWRMMRAGRQS